MSLVTREEKGSKLTIQEMDGNLTYLENLTEPIGVFDYTTTTVAPTIYVETIVKVLTIPANTFKNNDFLQLCIYNSNNRSGVNLSGYINSSNSLTGANKIINTSANSTAGNMFISQIMIKANKFLSFFSEVNSGDTVTNFPIDLTVDNYLIATAIIGDGNTTVTIEGMYIQKIN